MNKYFIDAIFVLYPEVTVIRGDVAYDAQDNEPVAVQEEADKLSCKNQAKQLLSATDWTSIADVANPAVSNPYLTNQAEFLAYRSTVRGYAVNPVANPTWPTQPTEQWSS